MNGIDFAILVFKDFDKKYFSDIRASIPLVLDQKILEIIQLIITVSRETIKIAEQKPLPLCFFI